MSTQVTNGNKFTCSLAQTLLAHILKNLMFAHTHIPPADNVGMHLPSDYSRSDMLLSLLTIMLIPDDIQF
jgi:hypothetical protein